MKKIVLISILVLIFGCKSENRRNQNNFEAINDYLEVILKIQVLEDDQFEIFYAENIKDDYTEKNKVNVNIIGDKEFQNVVIKLPNRVYPLKLRIDIGASKIETSIEIEEIQLSTGKNKKIFMGQELKDYFRTNNYIIPLNSNKYSRLIVNGKYDPSLLSIDLTNIITDLFSE